MKILKNMNVSSLIHVNVEAFDKDLNKQPHFKNVLKNVFRPTLCWSHGNALDKLYFWAGYATD